MLSTFVKEVLVPISNSASAMPMLELAAHLIHPEQGRVYALFVHVTGEEPDAFANIKAITGQAQQAEIPVELVERTAISAERGILDAARELGVDLIILGFPAHQEGDVHTHLSGVIEDVAAVAPAHLLIYQHQPDARIKRILVPVRGSLHSQVAAEQAAALAVRYQIPITALHIQQRRDLPPSAGMSEIERALRHLPPEDKQLFESRVVYADSVVAGIKRHSDRDTLVVLGFSEGTRPDQWLLGELPQQVMEESEGPVILVRRAIGPQTLSRRITHSLRRAVPLLTFDEREEVSRNIQEMARFSTNFIVLIIVSAILASLGLLQNNGAVIIGAMLVAPLMLPLMAIGVGMAQVRYDLLRQSFMTIVQGVLIVLITSFLIGLIAPLKIPTREMLKLSEPTVIDMGIALASGVVAAFALGRKDIPSAIAGVAIAAALEPPMCTSGLALAFGEMDLFLGASLLVILNLICISLAAYATFTWMGMRSEEYGAPWRRSVAALLILLLLAVPLTFALLQAVRQARTSIAIQTVLERDFAEWNIVEVETSGQTPLVVTVTLRGQNDPSRTDILTAEQDLESRIDRDIRLEIVSLRLFVPPEEDETGDE